MAGAALSVSTAPGGTTVATRPISTANIIGGEAPGSGGGRVDEKMFDGVAWKPWRGSAYSLKRVEMKIRPRGVGRGA